MSLFTQIQVTLGTIGIGGLYGALISIFNLVIDKRIKIILEPLFFLFLTYLYYLFLIEITKGVWSIYFPLFLLSGFLIYKKFYSSYINASIIRLKTKINKKINLPIKLKIEKVFAIIKKKVRGGRKRGKQKQKIEK